MPRPSVPDSPCRAMRDGVISWETPYSSVDALHKGLVVQVISDKDVAMKAMLGKSRAKDMSNWYGHVVTIVEVDKRRGTIKCAATGRNAKKDPTIWLAPGALTSVVRSTEDLVRRNLDAIYRAVHRQMELLHELNLHVFCPEAPQGGEMYCTGADRVLMDPVIMTHGAQGHYYCTLRLPEGRTSVTLSFVLNKNTSGLLSRGVDYVRDYLRDLFAAKPTEGLLHARLDLSLQPDSIEPVFHELQLEKGKNIPQEELFDRFVCAFHEEVCTLGAEMEAALMRSIQHFSQLYNQLRRAPKLDRYLKVLEQPCFASQGAFAAYVLGRLGTTPLPGGLVLVEQRNSGKKDATNRMLREVVQVEGKDLLVRPLIVFKGKAERVQRQAAELIAIELSGAEKVLESLRCSSDSLEFALLRDDEVAQHGLHRLMVSDAKKGGEQWINFTRFLVTLEAEVGKLGLHTILQPVSFCRAGHRDAEIRASLQDMRPCIDEMTPETREAFFKALLGERFCIMDLVWVLSACEAPPQRSTLQAVSSLIGLGSAAANDDGEALVHKILGSLACTHYIQQMKLCPANLGDVGRAFAGASGFVRGQLPHLMEELLTRAIRGAWPNLEDAMAGFAQLLDAAGDTEELKRCVQLLWQVCAATPKGQPELCQRVLRHLAGYMHFLEASAVFSQYIALRMES
ncbi:unnamed protein product, partial [Effrenium voratum]